MSIDLLLAPFLAIHGASVPEFVENVETTTTQFHTSVIVNS